jgi:hypothetical protein
MALGRFYQSIIIDNLGPTLKGRELLDRLPDSVNLIVTCLSDDRFTAGFYPKLLTALAEIIYACPRYIVGNVRERLFGVYWKAYCDLNCDPANPGDVAHANDVFAAVFAGFRAILATFPPGDALLSDIRVRNSYIIGPPKKFLAIGSFTCGSMLSFCLFLQQFDKVYARKGNIVLNRTHNWQILLHGQMMKDQNLKELVNNTIKLLGTA